MTKKCTGCSIEKPIDAFGMKTVHGRRRQSSRCRACLAAQMRRWYAELKTKPLKYKRHRAKAKVKNEERKANGYVGRTPQYNRFIRLRKYGLTVEQFWMMKEAQHGKCRICNRLTQLVVDHDHESGVVRGLLCLTCNSGMGLLHDDVATLKSAIAYLEASISVTTGAHAREA